MTTQHKSNGFPPLFTDRVCRIFKPELASEILRHLSEPRVVTIRVNTLKSDAASASEVLKHDGFSLDPVEWYPGAFIVRGSTARQITETTIYKEGKIYIQSLSSLIPALLLDPRPGETVCDLCAAPGSKTTQIACLMKNEGRIIAIDNSKGRFYKLRANLSGQGVKNTETLKIDGEIAGRKYPEFFDRVLLDASCSVEGRFNLGDPKSFHYWSPKKIKDMARKQKRLLISAYRALKPGGVLVYSTCTFAPEENEASLTWLIERTEEAILPEAVLSPVKNVTPGLERWEDKVFHPSLKHALRILPTDTMEGFFVSRLRRI
ncbi:MAG: RsmB/NOP family class I SAM-dependent RNA methyltransferase [Candidatus Omnitrophica bacterium]|nr:RsmB/NOP family class I SAM-dependent RNA methyltransferase [Candidatus Omnitrophota bacterium]